MPRSANTTTQAQIERMVKRIVKRFHPEQIILFGSQARGDAGPDSDVDLLVVMNVKGSVFEQGLKIRGALIGISVSVDIIVTSPEDLAWRKDIVGTIEYPATHEGKVLYARTVSGHQSDSRVDRKKSDNDLLNAAHTLKLGKDCPTDTVCFHVQQAVEEFLDAYLEGAGIASDRKGPLFRSAAGKTGRLTPRSLTTNDALRMVKRRARKAGLSERVCNHSFRATGITVYLDNGGSLEGAQALAAHESPRTTKLYDRTGDEITLDEVERIAI